MPSSLAAWASRLRRPPLFAVAGRPETLIRPLKSYQWAIDSIIAVVVFGLFIVAGFLDSRIWPGIVFNLLVCAALVIRRWSPAIALGTVWIAALFVVITNAGLQPAGLVIGAVIYAGCCYGTFLVQIASGLSTIVGAALLWLYVVVVYPFPNSSGASMSERLAVATMISVMVAAYLACCWLAGFAVIALKQASAERRESEAARREQERMAHDVVIEQERNRIARDMHDVVAHSLAVVVAQANGARFAMRTDPSVAEEALGTIGRVASSALGDVRGLLHQLRHSQGEGPQPMLDDVPRLIDDMRLAGLTIDYRAHGPMEAPATVQHAAFRIVQESLTNALRHGDVGNPVIVDVDTRSGALVLIVRNVVGDPRTGPIPGRGHGLVGIRERAALVGGSADIFRGDDVFTVRATLPIAQAGQGSVAHPSGRDVPRQTSTLPPAHHAGTQEPVAPATPHDVNSLEGPQHP